MRHHLNEHGIAALCGNAERFAVLIPLVLCLSGFTTTTIDPHKVEIATTDVAHFWRAFDEAAKVPPSERASIYRKEYFDHASLGLKEFAGFRHVTPDSLATYVEQHRAEYVKLRPYIQQVVDQKPIIQAAFHRFQRIYLGIKLPAHVYFVVGQQHGAGMNAPDGIILAADVFATPPGTPYSYSMVSPAYVPFSVLHETVHFNQVYETSDKSTLLQEVINEGTADFIASLVIREPDVRQMTDRWKYGCPRERGLYAQFVKDEDLTHTSPWMFDHHPAAGWPPDMGYWLGYRIVQTYFYQATNKHAALRELLNVKDFHKLLSESGYPAKAPACHPAAPMK
jgi:Predicted Zn-dependent protease (DUF2268)